MATKSKSYMQIVPDASNDRVEYLVTSKSKNTKTGNVPTVLIGQSLSHTARSCFEAGCPLLPKDKGGPFDRAEGKARGQQPCYAWQGNVQRASGQSQKAFRNGNTERYSLRNALLNAKDSAEVVRVSSFGDPCALDDDQAREIIDGVKDFRENDRPSTSPMHIIGYTHKWNDERMVSLWVDQLMASVHTMEDADKAFDMGWRPALEIVCDTDPGKVMTTPKGRKMIVCPHLLSEKHARKDVPDCNDCKLCVVSDRPKPFGIVFPNHH